MDEFAYSRSITFFISLLLSPSQIGPAKIKLSLSITSFWILGHSSFSQPCLVMSWETPASILFFSYATAFFVFFNVSATTKIYSFSLHDALPIPLLLCPKQIGPAKIQK